MARLCERPGCSEPALVAYGMRAEDLVFWLDVLRPDTDLTHGVLCRRHADSMIVPRHWTLDDLRDPEPRLFRPVRVPATTSTTRTQPLPDTSVRRRTGRLVPRPEQMTLVADGATDVLADPAPSTPDTPPVPPILTVNTLAEPAVAWTPTFDVNDDLDGLLAARSPLLARAFRGHDRPRPG